MRYYFAYGSNMNPDRLRERGVDFIDFKPAVLRNYRLTFNKRCFFHCEDCGCANIEPAPGRRVEGILYELAEPEIAFYNLDIYEGYPDHYDRKIVSVETSDGIVEAITYVAQPSKVMKGLRPSPEYLNHLLVPCKMGLLSEDYCKELLRWKHRRGIK